MLNNDIKALATTTLKGIENRKNIPVKVPKHFFCPQTNSIMNPISLLPMPNVTLCLSYSWLCAESVGFGQKNGNWSMLGYGRPRCDSAGRLIKRLATSCIWPETRSFRPNTIHKHLSISSPSLQHPSEIMKRKHTTLSNVVAMFERMTCPKWVLLGKIYI